MSSQDQYTTTKSALRKEIQSTRRDLEEKLTVLEQELSPGQLVDKFIHGFRETTESSPYLARINRNISENPLPLVMTCVGLGWTVVSSLRQEQESESDGSARDGASDGRASPRADLTRRGEAVVRRAQDYSTRAQEKAESGLRKAHDTLEKSRESADAGARRARHDARHLSRTVGAGASELGEDLSDSFQARPIAGLLAAFGFGSLIGALIPNSRLENQYGGPHRDRLVRSMKTSAADAVREGERMIYSVADELEQEWKRDSDRPPVDRAADALKSSITRLHKESRHVSDASSADHGLESI